MNDLNESTLEDLLNEIAGKKSSLRPTEIIMSSIAVDMVDRGEIDAPDGIKFVGINNG